MSSANENYYERGADVLACGARGAHAPSHAGDGALPSRTLQLGFRGGHIQRLSARAETGTRGRCAPQKHRAFQRLRG